MKATYIVPFEDIDYETWAAAHGLAATHEPDSRGFLLHVEGTEKAINDFSAELSWQPETTSP